MEAVTDPMTFMVDEAFARVKVLANKFVVVKAFDTYRLPDITADAFERVKVFANRFVVVNEFETAKFVKRPTLVMLV